MTVIFKAIKYRHLLEAMALGADIEGGIKVKPGDPVAQKLIEFSVALVKEWDYIDEETGAVVPFSDYEELTLDQFNELMAQFNVKMGEIQNAVPKPKALPSSYGRTQSKAKKPNSRIHPPG